VVAIAMAIIKAKNGSEETSIIEETKKKRVEETNS